MSEFNAIAANLSNNFTIDTVVVAAGVGKRFGSQMPKQYTHIGGQTVLQHSIAALSKVHQLSTCYLVISEEDAIAKTLGFSMPIEWVIGGKERMNSVFNAVQTIWQQYQNPFNDKAFNDKNEYIKTDKIIGGGIVKNGIEFEFTISDTGYISKKINIHYMIMIYI